jgi:hypothetical protein
LALAGSAGAARADIAAGNGNVRLYWVDGANVHRARCRPDTILYSRANCQLGERLVAYPALHKAVSDGIAPELPQAETHGRELVTEIGRIDTKLLELLDQSTGEEAPESADLREEIDRLREELAPVDAHAEELRDQIVLAERELEQRPNPDVQAQLVELRAALAEALTQQTDLESQLTAARARLVEINSPLLDEVTYRALQTRRLNTVNELTATRGTIDGLLRKRETFERTLAALGDTGFTWNISAFASDIVGGWAVVAPMEQRFDEMFESANTFQIGGEFTDHDWRGDWQTFELRANVPVSGSPSLLRCTMEADDCSLWAYMPDGTTLAQIMSHGQRSVDHHRDVESSAPITDELEQLLFTRQGGGTWTLKAFCEGNSQARRVDCTIRMN